MRICFILEYLRKIKLIIFRYDTLNLDYHLDSSMAVNIRLFYDAYIPRRLSLQNIVHE